MAELKELTPIFLGLLATAVAWLFKSVIQLGKDVVSIQTALKIYFEGTAKGAAKVLDSPNPTPDNIRVLLRKYYDNHATDSEKDELKGWLKNLINDPTASKAERSAAIDILSAMNAMNALFPKRKAYGHH